MFADVAEYVQQGLEAPAGRRRHSTVRIRTSKSRNAVSVRGDHAERPVGSAPTQEPTQVSTATPVLSRRQGYDASRRVLPYEADLQRAAEVLNAGKKVAIPWS